MGARTQQLEDHGRTLHGVWRTRFGLGRRAGEHRSARGTFGRTARLHGFMRSARAELGRQLTDGVPHRLGGTHICGFGANRDLQGLSSTTGSVCGRPGSIQPHSIHLLSNDSLARLFIDLSVHPAGRAGARSNVSKKAAGESKETGYSCHVLADLALRTICPWDATRGARLAHHSSFLAGPRISAPESRAGHAHLDKSAASLRG